MIVYNYSHAQTNFSHIQYYYVKHIRDIYYYTHASFRSVLLKLHLHLQFEFTYINLTDAFTQSNSQLRGLRIKGHALEPNCGSFNL